MAANEAYPLFWSSWCAWCGLIDDHLYITFLNGECAIYNMPLVDAQRILAELKVSDSPGGYTNYRIKFQGYGYRKAADPTGEILGNLGKTCLSAYYGVLNRDYARPTPTAELWQKFPALLSTNYAVTVSSTDLTSLWTISVFHGTCPNSFGLAFGPVNPPQSYPFTTMPNQPDPGEYNNIIIALGGILDPTQVITIRVFKV